MIKFEPEAFFDEFVGAVRRMASFLDDEPKGFLQDEIDFLDDEFDATDYEDLVFTPESTLTFSLPRCDDDWRMTYREFVALADEIKTAELRDHVECWTSKRVLLRVELRPNTDQQLRTFLQLEKEGFEALEKEADVSGKKLKCRVCSGHTIFGLIITATHYWTKYYPPVLENDVFIEIQHSVSNERTIREVMAAYLFELSATLGLDFCRSPRAEADFDPYLDDDNESEIQFPPLRDLILGGDTLDLLNSYNQAIGVADFEVQVVLLTRVFEYVSRTVLQQQLIDTVRSKLLSPRALNPTANFILELEQLIETHRSYRKDRDAIILTCSTCCEATELSIFAPAFLPALRNMTALAKRKDCEEALGKLGSSLVATRNAIAHAKANYLPTGEECPADQLSEFVACVRVAAQQAVRWFGDRNVAVRVV